MKRREFLKNGFLISIGGVLIPKTILSCRKDTLFEESSFSGKVIIIGAGAAGLYAGYILKSKSIDFQILEASNKYGGRVGKNDSFADFPIDNGAQWLHGKNNILSDFILSSNTKITLDDTENMYWFKNNLVKELPKNPEIFDEDNLPDVSFQQYANQKEFGIDYKYIIENLAGDQGASASKLSAYWNHQEEINWVSGDDDYKFEQTYFDFFETQIVQPIKNEIKLNTIVKSIDYTSETITIIDSNNQKYIANKVIITVPISILKKNKIEFSPQLPNEKTEAFSKIGMGAGMKVFLKFSTQFYDDNILGGSICAAYANEKIGKTGEDNVLLAFIMGEQAEYLTSLGNDDAITLKLLEELDLMYNNQATKSFISSYVNNFTNKPFIEGAYSYSTINIGNAREKAAESIDNKLFFAGEAMNLNGHHQTVFGAAETGYREVINILKNNK
jgi:monoamine oxidase